MALLSNISQRIGFNKQQRLTQPSRFKTLFDTPEYRQSNRVFLVLAKKNQLDHACIGLVVSKKKAKRAVDRNLIKRISRESFRKHQHQLVGLDIVVLLRSLPPEKNRQLIRSQLEELWLQLLAKVSQD